MRKNILRAFFDSGPITSREEEKNNQRIIDLLNRQGCNVIQTVMGSELSYLDKQSKKAAANIYFSKLNDIRSADIFVCEMSFTSPLLVFEIFETLRQKKPVLVLYNEKSQIVPDTALLGNPSSLLFVETYNKNNLEEKIINFIKKARRKIPISRFTVRLTKEMGDYVNFLKTKMKCSSKNDVVVKILERMMEEDYDFLKDYD